MHSFLIRRYTVTCVSTTASTLQDSKQDTSAQSGSSSFSLTLSSGVVDGTTYECSVKMTKSGYTSAKSPPAFVTTPAATGM